MRKSFFFKNALITEKQGFVAPWALRSLPRVFKVDPNATIIELVMTTVRTETKSERNAYGKRTIARRINDI